MLGRDSLSKSSHQPDKFFHRVARRSRLDYDLWFDRNGSIRILSIDSKRSCVVNVRELVPISWTDVRAFNL